MKDRKKRTSAQVLCDSEEGVKKGVKMKERKKKKEAREKRQSMTDWNRAGQAIFYLVGWLLGEAPRSNWFGGQSESKGQEGKKEQA